MVQACISRDGQTITVATSRGSVAELSRVDRPEEVFGELALDLTPPVFFFNRLKARVEREGEATKLMEELVDLLDREGFTVVNGVNAYGSMSQKDLKKFYEKYGFVEVAEDTMIRRPKEQL